MEAARLYKTDRAVILSVTVMREGNSHTAQMEPVTAASDAELDFILDAMTRTNPLVEALEKFRYEFRPQVVIDDTTVTADKAKPPARKSKSISKKRKAAR